MLPSLFDPPNRKLADAQEETERLESFAIKKISHPFLLNSHGFNAQIQILLKDFDAAEKYLNQAEEWYRMQEPVPPMYGAHYLRTKFLFDIELLEEAILSNNKSAISKYRKNAYKSCKKLLKNSRKYAVYRTGVFRLVGLYNWLLNKQKKAVKWWQRAVEEGERLGARPDLARTYMEIGKRLLEEKSKYKELNGISAPEYLEKARTMFQEMDFQWDLDELERIQQQF